MPIPPDVFKGGQGHYENDLDDGCKDAFVLWSFAFIIFAIFIVAESYTLFFSLR